MAEVFICTSLAFWFARRAVLPRLALVMILPIGTFVVFGISALRGLARGDGTSEWQMPGLSEISSIDFWALTPFASAEQVPELTNAFYLIRLSNELGFHTWGAESWNRIVFQWIPAQIVGVEIKSSLMFDLGVANLLSNSYNFGARTGATSTAMGLAYMEFGPLGIIFFIVVAYVMGRWWVRANSGDVWAMALYTCGLTLGAIMPTSYPIVFLNLMMLYGGALFASRRLLNPAHQESHRPSHKAGGGKFRVQY
ncbi:hypothetical protein [Mesorhizobium sp. M0898]|uniref:hypothetical protein n=1 Tax=Mesorhizobium sp. M0898 TaxID=2957020 RepID=UPI0033394FCE